MKIKSLGVQGLDIFIVSIETEISRGLFNFDIIGLGDRAIRESRTRILSSIKASHFPSPKTSQQKINVLLGPANIKKEGSHFDLPIALSYLEKTGLIKNRDEFIVFGELSLDGKIRSVTDIQTFVLHGISCGFTKVILPKENFSEILYLLDSGLVEIVSVDSLHEVVTLLNNKTLYQKRLKDQSTTALQKKGAQVGKKKRENERTDRSQDQTLSIDLITGQEEAKRALEISLAGKHHIVFYGPPGVGKSLIAKSAEELLPPISYEEIPTCGSGMAFSKVEITGLGLGRVKINSFNKNLDGKKPVLFFKAPFRNPHHTSSYSSIIGTPEKLGELSLAHNGILFLDEFAEFDRRTIEALRQPIEDSYVQVSRLGKSRTLPANVLVLATTNLCRCGNYQSETRRCTCTAHEINQYLKKISGPISERVDLWVQLRENNSSYPSHSSYISNPSRTSKTNALKNISRTGNHGWSIKETIHLVRALQEKRVTLLREKGSQTGKNTIGNKNKKINKIVLIKKEIEKLNKESIGLLNEAVKKLSLSSRSVNSIVSVARTIADINYIKEKNNKGFSFNLDDFDYLNEIKIEKEHILEALSYRKRF